jgi:hypothetical protein
MNAATWKRLVGPLIDVTWRVRRTLAYVTPVGWTLHGILGEGSPSQAGFYLWIVRMPLFVPTDVVDLNWSDRYGGGTQTFDEIGEATQNALSEAMRSAQREAQEAALVPAPPGGADNVRMQEARGYGLFLQGNSGGAIEVLGRVSRYPAKQNWEHEFVDRAHRVRSLISEGRNDEVQAQLMTWREDSLRALGIDPT